MPEPSIVAMGGYPDDALVDYVLALAPGKRLLYVPTAAKEDPASTVSWYERLLVTGGNTANALAIWRTHGFDEILREAWDRGVLLSGWSAGMICWFEHGVTDSFGPELAPMDCLGFLPGSACPHYDGEERRRPVYTELVADGFPAGVAADDDVALHYVGTELREVVTTREGATGYRVGPDGEEQLEAVLLR